MHGLDAYFAELGAVSLPGAAARTLTPSSGQAVREALQAAEDRSMWTLDAQWLPTAAFADQTRCVRVADFGGGYRSDPFVNGSCRNWAGSDVPPSCAWGVWKVAGCDSQVLLRALFQLPRYLWAQKKMALLLANKPTLRQFGPVLGDALASWVNDALALVSVLVYSTNIRFDDDGAFNWGERGRDTYAAQLVTDGVLLWPAGATPGADLTGVVAPRFYNNLGTRAYAGAKTVRAAAEVRAVPISKADFEPVVRLPAAPSSAHWGSEINALRALPGQALAKLRSLAKYFPSDFGAAVDDAERQLRHYVSVPFFRWQKVALDRWLLGLNALIQALPPDGTLRLEELKRNLTATTAALASAPESSLRAATAEEATRAGSGNPYSSLIATVVNLVSSTAGLVMAVVQPLLDALSRALVEAAGAATGRPALCPSLPYIRVFAASGCTVDIEEELRRLEASGSGGATPPSSSPPPPPPPAPPPTERKSAGGGLLVAAVAAGLLLSRLR